MAKQFVFKNPAVGGVAARNIGFDIPQQNELFFDPGGQLLGRFGKEIKRFDIASAAQGKQFATQGDKNAFVKQQLQAQGIDPNKLATISTSAQDFQKAGLIAPVVNNAQQFQTFGIQDIGGLGQQGQFGTPQGVSEQIVGPGASTFEGVKPGEKTLQQVPALQAQAVKQTTRVPFRQGLDAQQIGSVEKLLASKPIEQFNDTDIRNFAFATGINFKDGLDTAQQQSIVNLVANKPVGQWNDIDKRNWAFATNNAPLPSGAPGATDTLAQRVEDTPGGLRANTDFINGAFKALLGRDATQEELNKFVGQPVSIVRDFISNNVPPTQIDQALSPKSIHVKIPSEITDELVTNITTNSEIQSLLNEQKSVRNSLLKALKPTQTQRELRKQLANTRASINNVLQSFGEGIVNIEGQPIPMKLITGQAAALQKQANARLSGLQRQEANLLESLGLEQNIQQAGIDVLKTNLSFIRGDIQTQLQIEDRLEKQKKRVEDQRRQLRQDQKENLDMILSSMKGLTLDDIPPSDQETIAKLASNFGIGVDLLNNALKNGKDQLNWDDLKNTLNIAKTKAELNRLNIASQVEAAKEADRLNAIESGELTKEDLDRAQSLSKELNQNKAYSDMLDINNGLLGVVTGLDQSNGFGDIEAINAFQRMVDPGATVRAEDVKLLTGAAGIIAKFVDPDTGKISQFWKDAATKGKILPEQTVRNMRKAAIELYEIHRKGFSDKIQPLRNRSESAGIDFDKYVAKDFRPVAEIIPLDIKQSYDSLDSLVQNVPEAIFKVEELINEGLSDKEILQIFDPGFNNDLSMSIKGSGRLSNGKTSLRGLGEGTITGIDGSSLWSPGLDYVVAGGKGAIMKSPVSGKIVKVVNKYENPNDRPLPREVGKKQNGGFGNQIRIKTASGRELWISHLDDVENLRIGDYVTTGQRIGIQGNTGSTLGRTGAHIDLTMKRPNGKFYKAREVAALLGDQRLT